MVMADAPAEGIDEGDRKYLLVCFCLCRAPNDDGQTNDPMREKTLVGRCRDPRGHASNNTAMSPKRCLPKNLEAIRY